MKRSKHSLSHYKLLTCDMGQLIPVGLLEALPGDTFQQSSSMLLRMSPLVAPVMHPVSVRIHHWFVPLRLLWEDWEDFITGGPDGEGAATAYPTFDAFTPAAGSILDYMGVKPGDALLSGQISKLPVRAYNMIFNEFYRDEDLVSEVSEDSTDVQSVSWEKDYFTTARPWAQKGPSVTLPLGTTAVASSGDGIFTLKDQSSNSTQLRTDGIGNTFGNFTGGMAANSLLEWNDPKLQADLSSATAADVLEIRRAFALQRYQEARAQYGSRYTEYLRYLGVRPSDARLQRPEYLGGGKQTVAFSEVLRTGNTDPDTQPPIGEMAGHGIAAMRSNRYRYFCEEHGYILTLLSIRPRSMYVDGLHRTWSRRTKEDYYQKELELIGQQEVYNREVYLKGHTDDAEVFGFQDRYADYRHHPSQVSGEFRDILDYWHLGRIFTDTPTLNGDFVTCAPSKRVFAEQTQNSCWLMVSHSVQARRLVGRNTIGRIL